MPFYKCVETPVPCPTNSPAGSQVNAGIARTCSICESPEETGCIHESLEACIGSPCQTQINEQNCLNPGGTGGGDPGGGTEPGGGTTTGGGGGDPGAGSGGTTTTGGGGGGDPNAGSGNTTTTGGGGTQTPGGGDPTNTGTPGTGEPPFVPIPNTCINWVFNKATNYACAPPNTTTTLVPNEYPQYTTIFKGEVASEINYFLQRHEVAGLPWHENYFSNLTLSKIEQSLQPNLLTVFNRIHGPGNFQLSKNIFLSVIKQHLTQGTLSEFDPQHFQNIYTKQQPDTIVQLSQTGENTSTVNAALELFENNAINPDYNNPNLSPEILNAFRRMRWLPEDLGAYLDIVEEGDENAPSELYVLNSGAPVNQIEELIDSPINSNPSAVAFGDGAGYYFSTLEYPTSAIYPIATTNSLSAAYYLPNRARFNILTLLGADTSYHFTVISQAGVHEFSSSYDPSADVDKMYFALDFDSIEEVTNPNSVISNTTARYFRITDEEAIQHSRNYGFNVVHLNLDFRDPFIHYSRDVSTVRFRCSEFNLRSLGLTSYRGKVILKNIPQAIVMVPGCGSYHNPFNGRSNLDSFDGVSATRTFSSKANIDFSTRQVQDPLTEPTRIFLETGSNSLGAYEQTYLPDIHGMIYTYNPSSFIYDKAYYINNQYSRNQPDASYRTNSPEGKFMALVDSLTLVASAVDADYTSSGFPNTYGFLTWGDIFSRMNSSDIGRLKYCRGFPSLRDRVTGGYSNGIPVTFEFSVTGVNNTINPLNLSTGIPEEYWPLINPPAPIINSQLQRLTDFNFFYPGQTP